MLLFCCLNRCDVAAQSRPGLQLLCGPQIIESLFQFAPGNLQSSKLDQGIRFRSGNRESPLEIEFSLLILTLLPVDFSNQKQSLPMESPPAARAGARQRLSGPAPPARSPEKSASLSDQVPQ